MAEPRIKKCPNCKVSSTHKGNCRPQMSRWGEQQMGNFYVRCHSCGLHGPYGEDEANAIELWNKIRIEG
ncbi:Lar family restriction alleviation protein [Maridesulfovibrio sp.]|uniref:Lar family restriction alleviation protein n=1 Tax=Maridesulfovibrio sp. TaxID=2795000 RepID=UPI0029C9FDFE|nr:Lar family restriction alleviation protein [Maridesulfovibrio sp.]